MLMNFIFHVGENCIQFCLIQCYRNKNGSSTLKIECCLLCDNCLQYKVFNIHMEIYYVACK